MATPTLGHPHFFLRLVSNAFLDFGSVGRIKKKPPQNEEESGTKTSGTQHHCRGASWKQQDVVTKSLWRGAAKPCQK